MERRKEKGEEGVRMPSMGINGLPFKLGPGRGGGGRTTRTRVSHPALESKPSGPLSLSLFPSLFLSLRGGRIGVKPPAG